VLLETYFFWVGVVVSLPSFLLSSLFFFEEGTDQRSGHLL
jgi:hypothetical protein